MKIKDQVKNDFQSYGYEDAKLGRKLSDADYFILSKAKSYVQTYFEEMYKLIDDNISKLKTTKKILNIDSKETQIWSKKEKDQKILDEIEEAINILNNEIKDIEKEINSLNRMMTTAKSTEIENIFGILLYHYETGYLMYKYETGKKQISLPEEISYSSLTAEIIDQYNRNQELGKNNLD